MENDDLRENFNYIKDKFDSKAVNLNWDYSDFVSSFRIYNENITDWSNQILFNGLKESKTVSRTYVDLDLYLTPVSQQVDISEKSQKKSVLDTFQRIQTNIIILGQPGAGKTTSMKRIFQMFTNQELTSKFSYPLLIKLRELKDYDYSIFNFLSKQLNIKIETYQDTDVITEDSIRKTVTKIFKTHFWEDFDLYSRFFSLFFNTNKILLIIDGYDEVPPASQKNINRELKSLAQSLKASKFVLTSRGSDYQLELQNSTVLEICPLDHLQLKEFARNWLSDQKTSDHFLKQIVNSPYYDALIRPLTLSHLCAIYERIGRIPEKPKTVHRKVVSLLIEEWDEQRQITRDSKYQNFEQDRKFEFLANFAFSLTVKFEKTIFTRSQLIDIYNSIYQNFGLPKEDLKNVIKEIETHTGIIVSVGQDQYEFTHKSTQEYLTAEHLIRLPNIPTDVNLLMKLPNELALTISLCSSPALYFQSLLFDRLSSVVEKIGSGDFGSMSRTRQMHARQLIKEYAMFFSKLCSRIVIEKPDFPETAITSICVLMINSILIDFDFKLAPHALVKKWCSLPLLTKYYTLEENTVLDGSVTDHLYFRRNSIALASNYRLPNRLTMSYTQYQHLKNAQRPS
jgi:hypothetical protein